MNLRRITHAFVVAVIVLAVLNAFVAGMTFFPRTEIKQVQVQDPLVFNGTHYLQWREFVALGAPMNESYTVCWDITIEGGNGTLLFGESQTIIRDLPVNIVGNAFSQCYNIDYYGLWLLYVVNWDTDAEYLTVNYKFVVTTRT